MDRFKTFGGCVVALFLWVAPAHAAWVEVTTQKCNGNNGCTTGAANTSGGTGPADTYVLGIHGQAGSLPVGTDLSDSTGANTYTCKHIQTGGLGATADRMCYAWNVTTSASMTWTVTKTGCTCSVTVLAMKGGQVSADPFDAEAAGGGSTTGQTFQPGSLTAASGELYVSSAEGGAFHAGCAGTLTINSSFSTPVFQDFVGSTSYGGAISWKESTGAAENPTWTCGTLDSENEANMLALKAAGGGGGSGTPGSPSLTLLGVGMSIAILAGAWWMAGQIDRSIAAIQTMATQIKVARATKPDHVIAAMMTHQQRAARAQAHELAAVRRTATTRDERT